MRRLRFALFLVVLLGLVVLVLAGSVWMYALATQPHAVETEHDIEAFLRNSFESERQSLQAMFHHKQREAVRWDKPDLGHLPPQLVNMYLSENGCPGYLKSEPEGAVAWSYRLLQAVRRHGVPGDGSCELDFARRIALQLGSTTALAETVTADRVRSILGKKKLVAYNLEGMWFERGIVGVEAASALLMQKPLGELDLGELAELAVALPPHEQWDNLKLCTNAALIRQNRDVILDGLVTNGIIARDAAKSAASQPVRCLSVQR